MNSQTASSAPSSQPLYDALLDYIRSPGKSNVAMREPALLFASFRQILQIAAGRALETEVMNEERKAALRRAACFFTRTALLYPGADHYTLMGLDRNFDGPELKDHYRLLMRLIHPDFAGTLPFAWPADAAVRVNLAYEVLSTPARRSEYEKSLATAPRTTAPTALTKVEHRRTAVVVRKASAGISRSRLKQLVMLSSFAGICVVLGGLMMGGQEPVRLVQRAHVSAAATKPAPERLAAVAHDTAPMPGQPEPKETEVVAEQGAGPQSPTAAAVSALVSKMFAPASGQGSPVAKAVARAALPAPIQQPSQGEPARLPSSTTLRDNAAPSVTPAAADPAPTVVAYIEPAPIAAPARAIPPVPAPSPVPAAIAIAAPVATPVPRPVPVAGLTLSEAQPLLSKLLQQLESGVGDRVIGVLEREARSKPEAQALSRQYDDLVAGMRPVRLSQVEFKAEPADGRLLVTGQVQLVGSGLAVGAPGKKMVLRAEFASREGAVVMTGLSGVAAN